MTDDLRRTLLSLADAPLAGPDPLDDLDRRWRRRRHRRYAVRSTVTVVGAVLLFAGAVAVVDGDRTHSVGVTATAPTTAANVSVPAPADCRNSYDPACGPFRWDPEPVAADLIVTVTAEPANPAAGQEVVFTVTGATERGDFAPALLQSGDGGVARQIDGARSCASVGLQPRYGPWDLPPPKPSQWTYRFAYTYAKPGTYTARFALKGSSCFPQSQPAYPSGGEATLTVTVGGSTAPPTTALPTTATTAPSTATTAPASDVTTTIPTCRNSHDPACGPFRWDPGPLPSPVTVTVTATPANPKPGQEVTFVAEATSPYSFSVARTFQAGGDGAPTQLPANVACTADVPPPRYGPWDVPPTPSQPQTATARFTYTYTAPGTYVARIRFETFVCHPPNPFPGDGEGTVRVVVGN